MSDILFDEAKQYYKDLGYTTLQEFIVDLVRNKVILENIERYKSIENRMKRSIGVKKFGQKDAIKYLRSI